MGTSLLSLPSQQLKALATAYEQSVAAKRRQSYIVLLVLLALTLLAAHVGEVSLSKLFGNIQNFTNYFINIITELRFATFWADMKAWMWGINKWTNLIVETLLMAYVGTIIGAGFGFLLCFFAAQNLMTNAWLRFAARRFLEFSRTVPELVFALIFVIAFGLGPVPGVLAIAIHTMGALGKLFAEVVENIDMKPVDGMRAAGASWPEMVRFAALPQVLPAFASYGLLRFEINVRGATVMGFVGAGGIGQEFLSAIRSFYYSDISAMLALIIVTVFTIDLFTSALRHRLIGSEAR